MWRILESNLNEWRVWRYRRKIERALALYLRGEARNDGLKLNKVRNRLEIQWRVRDIHPWDRELAQEPDSLLIFEHTLADTEAAISRLFQALPQVDVIDLSVLDPASDSVILAGTVYRSTLDAGRQLLSVGMRLRELGVRYHLAGSQLESLD